MLASGFDASNGEGTERPADTLSDRRVWCANTDAQPNPENTIKQMWERLAAGIKEIQNHNASSLSYEEHYRYAYNMVLYKRRPNLPLFFVYWTDR